MRHTDEQRLAGTGKGNVQQATSLGQLLCGNIPLQRKHQILIGRCLHDIGTRLIALLNKLMKALNGFANGAQDRRIKRDIG